MKTTLPVIPLFLILIAVTGDCQDIPRQVGGFILGTDIRQYRNRLRETTAMPVRYKAYLVEIEIRPDAYFKSGLIAYGTCDQSEKILRIRLKYRDGSRTFYEQLLERLKKRFGEPVEWRGDPFQTVLAWKWSFIDRQQNAVSLTLQHNTKDKEQKLGNSIKLTLTSQIRKEQACHQARAATPVDPPIPSISGPVDWRLLIPE
ncbi:MAG: hypothetical protein ACOZF0_13695 [Thermodesulfobacteriota bacterium]